LHKFWSENTSESVSQRKDYMQKRTRNILFYSTIIGGGALFMYWIATKGSLLETDRNVILPHTDRTQWQEFLHTIVLNYSEPLAILLAQILAIILVARLFGWLANKIGQPTVIGEIIAGIVLGPSLIGAYFPEFYTTLFPEHSFNNLKMLSNMGLILFMFVVGMELDLKVLKTKVHEAIVISHASIIFPFALGMGLAYFLYESFAPLNVPFLSFALFLGISMSITAFPVLARIVQEKGLNKTKLGTIVLTCAAVDDITAWCVLAVVIAIVKAGSVGSSLYTVLFAVLYVIVMIKVVKPFLNRIGELHNTKENLNKSVVAIFFLVLVASAFSTETIGIHALFGAFMAGAIMPDNKSFRHVFVEKVEDVATVLLLPLFFVYTGLRTKIGLLNEPGLWIVTGWIILVAVMGKFIGSSLAARYVGRQSWRESLIVGALMNTRGLMELVVINIGYDLGILTPEVFAMMVIMALVTTFMTSPSLGIINRLFPNRHPHTHLTPRQVEGTFRTAIALGNAYNGKLMLNVAKTVFESMRNFLDVTVFHFTVGSNVNPMYEENFYEENFRPVLSQAEHLNIPIHTEYGVTDDLEADVVRFVNEKQYDFLLIGGGLSLSEEPPFKEASIFKNIRWLNGLANRLFRSRIVFYPSMLMKDKTRYFVERSQCSVGIFVNRSFTDITHTLIVIRSEADQFLLRYARRLMINNQQVTIDIDDVHELLYTSPLLSDMYKDLQEKFSNRIKIIGNRSNRDSLYTHYSFMLISYPSWNEMLRINADEFRKIPSTLIINKKPSRFTTGYYKDHSKFSD